MHTQRERDIKAEELFLYLLIYKNSILIAEELLTYKQRGKRLKAEIKEQRKNAKKKASIYSFSASLHRISEYLTMYIENKLLVLSSQTVPSFLL